MTFQLDRGALRRVIESPNGQVGRDLRRRAQNVESAARRLAPVDTGRMRASIHLEGPHQTSTGPAYDIVAATDYAIYVHDGTRRMRGRPFLTDALSAALR